MLIYSSRFHLQPKGGPQQIVDLVAKWIGKRSTSFVDGKHLFAGLRQRLKDGSSVVSLATLDADKSPRYPLLFCAQLSHADREVSGRRWISEVGFRQQEPNGQVECTILLKTDEISAKVTTPIQVTRPLIVETLVKKCDATADTPGLKVKRLDEASAEAYLIEVEREERQYPMVVVSPDRDGIYAVQPERLRSLLVGIADVIDVPIEVDTFKIENIVGNRYVAWGGAINVLFLARDGSRGVHCDRTLYRPADLVELKVDGKEIGAEILATVTHRINLPNSWKHISLEVVSRDSLHFQLSNIIQKAKHSDDTKEYAALLELSSDELVLKDKEVASLRQDLEEKVSLTYRMQSEITGLKHALNASKSSGNASEEDLEAMMPLREAVAALASREPSLEQSLTIVGAFFRDRVVILDSAYESAQDSLDFVHRMRGFELLWSFADKYWSALADGLGDMHGKRVFGATEFAQNEGQALSSAGRKRRTFNYNGTDILMEKHLKIGIKDSVSHTLRVHFAWISDEKRLVIGHCGKHLDF